MSWGSIFFSTITEWLSFMYQWHIQCSIYQFECVKSHAMLDGPSDGLLVTFWLAALVGSPFTEKQLLVSISIGDRNGPHHCQSSCDLTEMLANCTYKSKEVMYSENNNVKQQCICMYIRQSLSYFKISLLVQSKLLAMIEEILSCKLLLIEFFIILDDIKLCARSKMSHKRNCVTAVPCSFLIFMSKVFYFCWARMVLSNVSGYELNSSCVIPGRDRDVCLLHHVYNPIFCSVGIPTVRTARTWTCLLTSV
jgi:hypothetical protein